MQRRISAASNNFKSLFNTTEGLMATGDKQN